MILAFTGFVQPSKDLTHSSEVTESTNESILHHIRQKGPMVSNVNCFTDY